MMNSNKKLCTSIFALLETGPSLVFGLAAQLPIFL